MAAFGGLLSSCIDSLKSVLISQGFGAEYELICSELSVQWLRITLWGDALGLQFSDDGLLRVSLFHDEAIESTITQSVTNITVLFAEIEVLRQKYELKPPADLLEPATDRPTRTSKMRNALSESLAVTSLRRKMKDNQRQKSLVTIARWAIRDAKKLDARIRRLKSLIDGLEDIATAAGITYRKPHQEPHPEPPELSLDDNPPPYSCNPPTPSHPPTATRRRTPVTQFLPRDPDLRSNHATLKAFLDGDTLGSQSRTTRARDKLLRLSDSQFKELRVDVCDELARRTGRGPTAGQSYPFLPVNSLYHHKRNEGRQKLSSLSAQRFHELAADLVFELERRFVSLRGGLHGPLTRSLPHMPSTFSRHIRAEPAPVYPFLSPPHWDGGGTSAQHPLPHSLAHVPPPLPRNRTLLPAGSEPSHLPRSRFSERIPATTPRRIPPRSPRFAPASAVLPEGPPASPLIPRELPPTPPEMSKSFRITMDDPTWKVLPAALKEYNIAAPWDQFALHLLCGDEDRRLDSEEKPLVIFKALERQGLEPIFVLRNISSRSGERSPEENDAYVPDI